MFKVGFAGTAKNTGKTTALMYFLHQALARQQQVGLTGIGYDGENLDHLTGLPKPRVMCPRGTIIATASSCLTNGTASYRLLQELPIRNALGQIYLAEVVTPGLAVIAGPNKRKGLHSTLAAFAQIGCEMALVDGAFGRMSPFVEVDGLILATGAARNRDINNLVRETRALDQIFALPVADKLEVELGNTITILLKKGGLKRLRTASLLSRRLVSELAQTAAEAAVIYIPGAVPGVLLRELCREIGEDLIGKTLLFSDPTKLLVSGGYEEAAAAINQIHASHGRAVVREKIALLALVVNPFYPYQVNDSFRQGFVNADLLKEAVAKVTRVPVINVRETGQGHYLDTDCLDIRLG